MDSFPALLAAFAKAVESNDGAGLAALFTPDGIYDDYFFGAHSGAAQIAAMLQRFHAGGQNYRWEFFEPLSDGRIAYSRYRFSYQSRPHGDGGAQASPLVPVVPVVFEGISRFQLREGRIEHYAEVFDRGIAFTQLGFAPERIARILARYANEQNARTEFRQHIGRFASGKP